MRTTGPDHDREPQGGADYEQPDRGRPRMRAVLEQDGENAGRGQGEALWHDQLADDAGQGRVDQLPGSVTPMRG